MKVVIAVHHFPPRHTGGAELRAYRTAAWLRARGDDARVICIESIDGNGHRGLSFEDDVYDGVPVRRLSFDLETAPDPFKWTYDNPWIGEHVGEYLSEFGPDLLHLISGYLMSGRVVRVAKDGGLAKPVPVVVSLTDFWFLCPRVTLLRSNGELCAPPFDALTCTRCLAEEKRRYRLPGQTFPGLMNAFWQAQGGRTSRMQARMAYLGTALDLVDAFVSPSQFLRDVFIETGLPSERIVFSRQGRDFPDLMPDVLRKTPAAGLRVGYMGQIAPHKGVLTLFEAVRQLPGVAVEVSAYGDPTCFPRYTRQLEDIARRDARLKLAGVYERTEVSRVLREIDVVVVPSIWYENSPNTILEAFAHRTPVIVSDLGGMAEMVEDGVDGLRFVAGDAADLARKLRQLAEVPGLIERLREGIKPVKTVACELESLQDVYQAVIHRAGEA